MKSYSKDFLLYVAAVELASEESKGSGDPNKFDHVAKDLHVEEFDDTYEELSDGLKSAMTSVYSDEVKQLAKKYS